MAISSNWTNRGGLRWNRISWSLHTLSNKTRHRYITLFPKMRIAAICSPPWHFSALFQVPYNVSKGRGSLLIWAAGGKLTCNGKMRAPPSLFDSCFCEWTPVESSENEEGVWCAWRSLLMLCRFLWLIREIKMLTRDMSIADDDDEERI